ncbi:MAG: hypothetical protein M1813_006229 [Trichoglossum hirsutum]|nr:MAG: hypothetical protein M1813_006229 [Trichoglossum hirsutum]
MAHSGPLFSETHRRGVLPPSLHRDEKALIHDHSVTNDEETTDDLDPLSENYILSRDETLGSRNLNPIEDLLNEKDGFEISSMNPTPSRKKPPQPQFVRIRREYARPLGTLSTRPHSPVLHAPRSPPPPPRSRSQSPKRGSLRASVADRHMKMSSDSEGSNSLSDSIGRYVSSRGNRYTRPPRDHGALTLVRRYPESSQVEDLMEQMENLQRENERLKSGARAETQTPAAPAYTFQVFHCFNDATFLDEPHWEPGERGPRLRSNNPVRDVRYFLDQHPEVAFVFHKDYDFRPPRDRAKLETKDGVFRAPVPTKQSLSLIASSMIEAVEKLVQEVPDFGEYFPYFEAHRSINAPYMFMFYCMPFIPDVLPDLDPLSRSLVAQLERTVEASHGYEYESARMQAEKGLVAGHLFKYLIRPGDALVDIQGPLTQAYVALDWAEENPPAEDGNPEDYEEYDYLRRRRTPKRGSKVKASNAQKSLKYSWNVPVSYWKFDGAFEMRQELLRITMKVGYEEEAIQISQLDIVPLEYAPKHLQSILEKRGRIFWQLRHKKFVTYHRYDDDELNNIDERYMVDIETYKKLHPHSNVSITRLRADLDAKEMASDEPPHGNLLLLFPPTIPGYNMLKKMWVDLYVDRISDIVWNKQAFQDLVVDEETKELVQALVVKQLVAQKSTDVISGKGNGLIILLHGAPGTGKTFTAEGVAEFAEKPLYRVTCGDVGTAAEIVEMRLQASFHLGKIWDCVVLLDEADVFLEERDMKDLNRNALVSVFLRALEYYDGILILTSNRVGTFDEAFKSRIQLALHYENLTASQRRKIWRNFMNRLKAIDEPNVDFDDILDHLDDLSKEDMNGREIRNAITTARQLAQFKDKPFCYSHLKHVIKVSRKFGKYLNDLRDGLTDDDLKREGGLRLSYNANISRDCGHD